MYSSDIKIIDMKHSVLDDGGAEELRRKYESLKLELSSAKKEDKAEIAKAIKKAEEAYKTVLDKFETDKKMWMKTGRYKFKERRYIDYKNKSRRPYWFFRWERYVSMNDYRESADAMADGYTFVEADKSEYIPELIAPGADNFFHFGGDLILMKIPLYDYLKMQMFNIQKSENASKNTLAKFRAITEKEGIDVPQEMIDSWVDKVHPR